MAQIFGVSKAYVKDKDILRKISDRDEVNDLKGQVNNLQNQVNNLNGQTSATQNQFSSLQDRAWLECRMGRSANTMTPYNLSDTTQVFFTIMDTELHQ